MKVPAYRLQDTGYPGGFGQTGPLPSRKETLAIVAPGGKFCGISTYASFVRRQLHDAFDITIFDLDQYLLRSRHGRVRKLGDRHIRDVCRALRGFDAVNLQLEHGTLGKAQRGVIEPSASFTTLTGREDEVIAYRARLADLTIVPHPQSGEDVAAADALHAVLFDSGRPVLLAPVQPPATIGRRVAIAWNGTSNAASALASVMSFVREAEAVCVLSSPDYFRRGPSAMEVVEYISHHGVAARILEFHAIERVTGAGLLAAAAEFGADLMSMGAYSSSSRLRQLILGGTTRHVLENATLPVLMNR